MGYEDRDYMRVTSSDRSGPRVSNPLWWILGLVSIILVVGILRRDSLPQPGTMEDLASTAGPVQVFEIQFAADPDRTDALLLLLKSFFRERGYDSTIHETADGSMTSASFARRTNAERLFQNIIYQRISNSHDTLKAKHQLQCQVLRVGVSDPGVLIEETLTLAEELRLRLERELPGIVTSFDKDPVPMTYDDFE